MSSYYGTLPRSELSGAGPSQGERRRRTRGPATRAPQWNDISPRRRRDARGQGQGQGQTQGEGRGRPRGAKTWWRIHSRYRTGPLGPCLYEDVRPSRPSFTLPPRPVPPSPLRRVARLVPEGRAAPPRDLPSLPRNPTSGAKTQGSRDVQSPYFLLAPVGPPIKPRLTTKLPTSKDTVADDLFSYAFTVSSVLPYRRSCSRNSEATLPPS